MLNFLHPSRLLNNPKKDRNICCKCGYDLTHTAGLPSRPSPPDLLCPECGAPVALREKLWTDGANSMTIVLSVCLAIALCAAVLLFVLNHDRSFIRPQSWSGWRYPLYMALRASWLAVLFVGPFVAAPIAKKHSALSWHRDVRATLILIPFYGVFAFLMVFGRELFRLLGS